MPNRSLQNWLNRLEDMNTILNADPDAKKDFEALKQMDEFDKDFEAYRDRIRKLKDDLNAYGNSIKASNSGKTAETVRMKVRIDEQILEVDEGLKTLQSRLRRKKKKYKADELE
jgi:SMC interacting uncharacterized protein involved in chromosome segregation